MDVRDQSGYKHKGTISHLSKHAAVAKTLLSLPVVSNCASFQSGTATRHRDNGAISAAATDSLFNQESSKFSDKNRFPLRLARLKGFFVVAVS